MLITRRLSQFLMTSEDNLSVFGYYDGETIGSGIIFGTPESGIAPAPVGLLASAAGESLMLLSWLMMQAQTATRPSLEPTNQGMGQQPHLAQKSRGGPGRSTWTRQ